VQKEAGTKKLSERPVQNFGHIQKMTLKHSANSKPN